MTFSVLFIMKSKTVKVIITIFISSYFSLHIIFDKTPLLFGAGDIYDRVSAELEDGGLLDCECIGGGRIKHNPEAKKIHVYGYSLVRRNNVA